MEKTNEYECFESKLAEFDVIIIGASFAGLSVASELKGNILLIDKFNICDF